MDTRALRFVVPVVLAALVVLAAVAPAEAQLAASRIRIGDHPAYVRVVVDFTGAVGANDVLLDDAEIFPDGRTALSVTRASLRTGAVPRAGHGVTARVGRATGGVRLWITAAPRRFKFVSYTVLGSPARLAVDLWKAAPPNGAAGVRDDGCIRLDGWAVGPGRFTARGRALQRLFENTLVVTLRDRDGDIVRQHPLTLAATPGPWRSWLRYRVARAQPGTLEAWVGSAKDGALDCLVQVSVALRPW